MRRRKPVPPDRETDSLAIGAEALAAEATTLLSGRYASFLNERRHAVPSWAWVNALAHRTQEDLAAIATVGAQPEGEWRGLPDEWRDAIVFLAGDVISYARAAGLSTAELQRSRLVPLELDLMRKSDDAVRTPGQLATLVIAVLREHRSARPS